MPPAWPGTPARAGDAKFKSTALPPEAQAVTAVPDTVQLPLDTGGPHARHDLLVIACDGLYESMNRQHVRASAGGCPSVCAR